jgi:hypothetical protein
MHLLVLLLYVCVPSCQTGVTVAEERLMEVYHVITNCWYQLECSCATVSNIDVPEPWLCVMQTG